MRTDDSGFRPGEAELCHRIRIVISDEAGIGSFGAAMASDPGLRQTVAATGYHYNTDDDASGNFKRLADDFDKEIWSSEGQATFSNSTFPWSGWMHYDAGIAALQHFAGFAKTGWENDTNTSGVWRVVPQASASTATGTNPVVGRNGGRTVLDADPRHGILWADDFAREPHYNWDRNGSFEVVHSALRQQVDRETGVGSAWNDAEPITGIGDLRWTNDTVGVDVHLDRGPPPTTMRPSARARPAAAIHTA